MTTVTIGVLRVKDAYRMSIEFSWTNTFAFLATSTNGGQNITSQFAGKRIFILRLQLGQEMKPKSNIKNNCEILSNVFVHFFELYILGKFQRVMQGKGWNFF